MRPWVVLLFLPLAGCLGGGTEPGLFLYTSIARGDPAPVAVDDCDQLLEVLNERAATQAKIALHQSVEGGGRAWLVDDVAFDGDMAVAATAEGASAADAQVTGTNNQEAGVDEADVIKTDGEWTYVVEQGHLWILHSDVVGNVSLYSQHPIENSWGAQLLLEKGGPAKSDDRLLLLTHGSAPKPASGVAADSIAGTSYRAYQSSTHITVYDLADRRQPHVIKEMWVEGTVAGARLVDGHAYIVVHSYARDLGLQTWAHPDDEDLKVRGLDWETYHRLPEVRQQGIRTSVAAAALEENEKALAESTLADHLPQVQRGLRTGAVAEPISQAACQRVLTNPDATGRGISTIVALEMRGGIQDRITQIAGSDPIVYGAQDALVLAAPSQDLWWYWAQPDLDEATDLHWFDLEALDVTHRASGRVAGTVQDSFGIDVHDGQLRVATTTGTWGRWWVEDPEPMMNHLAVFESAAGQLVQTGIVGGIAPGERIWSARFTDERAYIVTFEQIDPLWIIDLTGAVPIILGELEIPGVSTYIHPLSEDALLTIGYGPGRDGLGLDRSRIQVSLFNITDPSKPTRADLLDVSPGGGWSWSSATHEHKAFTYWAAIGKLAVPVSTYQEAETWNGQSWEYRSERHIGLRLIDVDEAGMDLQHAGEVSQDHLLQEGDQHFWGIEVQRSYFLGYPQTGPVSVYALSGLGITAHDLATLEAQQGVRFMA